MSARLPSDKRTELIQLAHEQLFPEWFRSKATGSAESAVLEACYEQLGVFVVPASEAEAYLPEGFEPYQPEGFEPENVAPSGEIAPLTNYGDRFAPEVLLYAAAG